MTSRRSFVWSLLLGLALPMVAPMPAQARCASVPVATELARSRYVFEGTLASFDERSLTFLVTATWKGTPPARVTVGATRRGWTPRPADVGRTFLVFAQGDDDAALSMSRCGASGPLDDSILRALSVAGASRTAR